MALAAGAASPYMRVMGKLLITLGFCLAALPAQAGELVMFESDSCYWCERWNDEIGVYYGKTREAKAAPLRRVDLFDKRPEDLRDVKGVNYTPTFVLMDEGGEVGRIVGYPGEDFFWPMLERLFQKRERP